MFNSQVSFIFPYEWFCTNKSGVHPILFWVTKSSFKFCGSMTKRLGTSYWDRSVSASSFKLKNCSLMVPFSMWSRFVEVKFTLFHFIDSNLKCNAHTNFRVYLTDLSCFAMCFVPQSFVTKRTKLKIGLLTRLKRTKNGQHLKSSCVMPDVNQNSKDLTLVMQKRLWNSFQFNFWKSNFEHYILYLEALEIVLNTISSL